MLQLPGVAVVDVLISAFGFVCLFHKVNLSCITRVGYDFLIDDERGSEMVVVQF